MLRCLIGMIWLLGVDSVSDGHQRYTLHYTLHSTHYTVRITQYTTPGPDPGHIVTSWQPGGWCDMTGDSGEQTGNICRVDNLDIFDIISVAVVSTKWLY